MEASFNILVDKLLAIAAKRKASNIHLTVSSYPALRIDDELIELTDEKIVTDTFVKELAQEWLEDYQESFLKTNKSIVLTKEIGKKFRIKVNFFYQKNFLSASLRIIPAKIPALINLGLPKSVYNLTDKNGGLIIVAGSYGSGRTTTIASLIEEINKNYKKSIVTIEDPIEYLMANNKSLVEQRQIGRDANSFHKAINTALESDVDVLVVGSTQDKDIFPLILEFANSGRLAIIHMDTTSVVQTIEHIFAAFPATEKQRAQLLLGESLESIIIQRLLPRSGGGTILAAEILMHNQAVSSLIKEGKIKQLTTIIQTSRDEGMLSLDQSLLELVKTDEVTLDNAASFATDPKAFRKMAMIKEF